MAIFKRKVITQKGKELIGRALSNDTQVIFTRIESTDFIYTLSTDISKITQLDTPKQSVNVSNISRENNKVTVQAVFTNEGLTNSYTVNAIGVYAKDGNANEVLFAILVADSGDVMPTQEGQTITNLTFDFVFTISDTVHVTLVVDNKALVTIGMLKDVKTNLENNYIKNINYATEQKNGIAKIYSEAESESTAEKVKEVVKTGNGDTEEVVNERLTGETVWSKLIKTLDHTKILSVRGLVKILSKFLKPATENEYGLVNFQTIKQVSPKPDLSPYLKYDRSFIHKNNLVINGQDKWVRCNDSQVWVPNILHMYTSDNETSYVGSYHLNGGRAYYKVPNRNGGNWCEIMDNHDMAVRDNRMNSMDADRGNLWGRANSAWDKANDAQVNRIYEIRLAGYITLPFKQIPTERNGYVVTGIWNDDNAIDDRDFIQMRILQFHRNGQWLNAYFA